MNNKKITADQVSDWLKSQVSTEDQERYGYPYFFGILTSKIAHALSDGKDLSQMRKEILAHSR